MSDNSKIPLVITKNSFSIKLTGKTAEALLQQPRPILWNNDGLYAWIPLKRVKNLVRIAKDKQKHAKANDLIFQSELRIQWPNSQLNSLLVEAKEMAQAIELMSQ